MVEWGRPLIDTRGMRCAVLVIGALLLWGCSECEFDVRIDLRTDFVPVEEFNGATVELTTAGGESVRRAQIVAQSGVDYTDGARLFSSESKVPEGSYLVHVTLNGPDGAPVVTRTVALVVKEDVGFTVAISRSSRQCDPDSCDADETCGLGPDCVAQECSELTPENCPAEPECADGPECDPAAPCSESVCFERYCFYRYDGGSCMDEIEWCNPDEGCLPRSGAPPIGDASMPIDTGVELQDADVDAPISDAGVDAFTPDAGIDAAMDVGSPEVGMCGFGLDDCDDDMTCETTTTDDPVNCGGCRIRCDSAPNAQPSCVNAICGIACDTGFRNCDGDELTGCERGVLDDPMNCGGCNSPCPRTFPTCIGGECVAPPFPSDGSEGPLEPTENMVLSAGVHQFTTINIPSGVTVRADGTGVLELYATGDIIIEGTIDVSGGNGAGASGGWPGGGGATGTGVVGLAAVSSSCSTGGLGGIGFNGLDTPTAPGGCGRGGMAGGGSGGQTFHGGGGGGGPAGGGGGRGGAGGNAPMATGGAASQGGEPDRMDAYRGGDGLRHGPGGALGTNHGGGGGSIGLPAISDLPVAMTFYPGSGGGGNGGSTSGGGGGGGGGGAVRIASVTSIQLGVSASILARGGRGVGSRPGGAGSGGVIYLSAPEMMLQGTVSAAGGAGTTIGGGAGGLGRIRLSVLEERCTITAVAEPPFEAGCAEAETLEFAYVARYPN